MPGTFTPRLAPIGIEAAGRGMFCSCDLLHRAIGTRTRSSCLTALEENDESEQENRRLLDSRWSGRAAESYRQKIRLLSREILNQRASILSIQNALGGN